MDIICDSSTIISEKDHGAGQHSNPPNHYDFKLAAANNANSACPLQKELIGSLRQWGLEGTLAVMQVQFCPSFKPHEEGRFLKQLLMFAAETDAGPSVRCFIDMDTGNQAPLSAPSIDSVEWEALKCTAMSMDFFDCLVEKGIVSETGDIRGCYSDTFEGVTVSDRLRELLLNPDSENADAFDPDQRRELLFHVFRALCVGGGVCQPDDRLEAYTQATKTLYKDLVSVQKNASTGALEIGACKVYRITGTNGGDSVRLRPPPARGAAAGAGSSYAARSSSTCSQEESPHDVCLVVVDLAKRRASVLRKEYSPFW